MKTFILNIVTPSKVVYEGESVSLIAPCGLGYLGVLVDHAPLVSNITAGKIITRDTLGKIHQWSYQGKGFLEVLHNSVSLLLDEIPVSLETTN